MPHTDIRLIAYELPTCSSYDAKPKSESALTGYPAGGLAAPVAAAPVDPPPHAGAQDAHHRLRRLASIVDLAKWELEDSGRDAPTTLKVFMAPEFYFRPPLEGRTDRRNMTYPLEDHDYIVEQLGKMFSDPGFDHWLIVAGTIMVNTTHTPVTAPGVNPLTREVFSNVCVIARGGTNDPVRVIHKRTPSNLDGVLAIDCPGAVPDYRDAHAAWDVRRRNVFTVDGLTFGIEICLDHRSGVLRAILADWGSHEPAGTAPAIDAHLLPAGGMNMRVESICARQNGVIFRNDGYASIPPGQPDTSAHSESYRVRGYQLPGSATLLTQPTGEAQWQTVAAPSAANPHWVLDIPQGPMEVPDLNDPDSYTFPQRLRFWPSHPLMPAAPPPVAAPVPVPPPPQPQPAPGGPS